MSSAKRKAEKRKRKRTALIVCRDRKRFWTTQAQFWQWVRDGVVERVGEYPLEGRFVRADEEKLVVLSNTVLNLANRNHLSEALRARRVGMAGK